MTYLQEYSIGCDKPIGDGFCTARTGPHLTHEEAAAYARAMHWDVNVSGLDFCPLHSHLGNA